MRNMHKQRHHYAGSALALAIALASSCSSSNALEQSAPRRISQLEQRIQVIPKGDDDDIESMNVYWNVMADQIEASDPVEDAKKDIAAGTVGFMAFMNSGFGYARNVYGVKCDDRKYAEQRILYSRAFATVVYGPTLRISRSFRKYAKRYNDYIIGAQGDIAVHCQSIFIPEIR